MRASVLAIALASFVLAACSGGDDDDGADFTACGGNAIAGWDLTSTAFVRGSSPDMCTGGVSGFIFFNDNGRYSLSVDIKDWKKSETDAACGFTAAYGGFYRVNGAQLCLGDSSVSGDNIPCDNSRPTTQHAVLDYCVAENTLQVSSDHFLSARVPTILTLTRRP